MLQSIFRIAHAITLVAVITCSATASGTGEVTLPAETKARLTLHSRINSKLSEPDDIVTATLAEPIYVDGQLALARGVEFVGRILEVSPAKRGQRSSSMSITFERIVTPPGEIPIAAEVTAIDDWDNEETLKADGNGKLKGGHRGEKTINNMGKGSRLGLSAGIAGAALGGAAGASGRQALGIGASGFAVGIIAGLLFTKGSEIRVAPGAILRIRFLKPAILPLRTTTNISTGSDQ